MLDRSNMLSVNVSCSCFFLKQLWRLIPNLALELCLGSVTRWLKMDELQWNICGPEHQTLGAHTASKPQVPKSSSSDSDKCWAATDGCPHNNINYNFTELVSGDGNDLKLGRKYWAGAQSAENCVFEEHKCERKPIFLILGMSPSVLWL